ncbi:alpha/beta fold hydrolase [Reyranella sp. CPCC 100927]|uniref:alpha/beta fold hydrolase n=1 Tax=Reyranella sp. CPCC 100927 TaxID=2599616 RepID=UPI0011B7F315|nr:alpha/beta hydrolase [Reyranella sp. CPCC 100927]TWT10810.1 alpha/beta fold hydrolase [Reyranella sp. CPCC 100927]
MQFVKANGTETAFVQSGKGPPLILLHGAEADHAMFDAFAPLLAAHFTVIACDQRDSGKTRNPPDAYSLLDLADDAAGLIEGLGHGHAHVFGTSLGGAIAQALAARHPTKVDRLVLSSTFRVGANLLELNPTAIQAIAALRAELPASAPKIAAYFFPAAYLEAHPQVSAIFAGNSRDEAQKARRAGLMRHPVSVDLAAVTAPALVLAASEDRLIPPAHTLSLADAIAGARTHTIQGVGHVATIQDPAAVARPVIDFLLG